MRLVVQRVSSAIVSAREDIGLNPNKSCNATPDREVARIGCGLVAMVGFFAREKSGDHLLRAAERLIALRIFNDERGRLNRSLADVDGELLLVPQVTLAATLSKGTRPSFHTAATPESARSLFDEFVEIARTIYPAVKTGIFQARMLLAIENDGPVTFILEEN